MKFFDWEIEIESSLKSYKDVENKRLAILAKGDDEIHITLEFDSDDNLVIHPRWNIKIIIIGDKKLRLKTNYLVDER